MKLDPSYLEYMSKEEFRVLTAIEIGMRNHEIVPLALIERISRLKRACTNTIVKLLLKNKFIAHENKKLDGYKLTYLGYDYLALQVFMRRGAIKDVLGKIGCGKESDIYKCVNENGDFVILKFTRLGRTSFRTIKKNRDYIQHRTSYNWLYLSRLSAVKEFTFMDLLYKNKFPTPVPIEQNRHGIVMSLVNGVPMQNISVMDNPKAVFDQCFDLIKRLAENGLIHSDFNEFNLLIEDGPKVVMIDFPQMVSTKHKNADFYFNRDVECIHIFFERRFNYQNKDNITLDLTRISRLNDLDIQVKASGFIKKEIKNIDDIDIDLRASDCESDGNESDHENENEDEDENENQEEEEENENEKESKEKVIPNSESEGEEEGQEEEEEKEKHEEKENQVEQKKETKEEEEEGHFSPDLSDISFEDAKELVQANQDLFSDDDGEDPLNLNHKEGDNAQQNEKEELKKQKKKSKKALKNEDKELDSTKVLKDQIVVKESDLAEKAKAFIQKQVQKQFKQKHKLLKKTNKTNNKVSPAEYM